jgi:hypothetical protein
MLGPWKTWVSSVTFPIPQSSTLTPLHPTANHFPILNQSAFLPALFWGLGTVPVFNDEIFFLEFQRQDIVVHIFMQSS